MRSSPIKLTLFSIDDITNWLNLFAKAVSSLRYNVAKRHSSLVAWDPKKVCFISDNIFYADGWTIFRVWLGPRTNGIAINPQRLYFKGDVDLPTSIPERNLLGNKKLPVPTIHARISGCLNLAKEIELRVSGFHGDPMPIEHCRQSLNERTFVVLGNSFKVPAGGKMGSLLISHGFSYVPPDFEVIIAAENMSHPAVVEYKKHLESALKRCALQPNVSVISYNQADKEFSAAELNKKRVIPGKTLLVAISGRRGEDLSPASNDLLNTLELKKIPFRLFSVNNESLQWSSLDQLGSILQAAGGIPYVLQLPWPRPEDAPFLLGVDLGHPLSSSHSWIALSLVDDQGVHLESWRCYQPRDETVRFDLLMKGLQWVREALQRNANSTKKNMLIFRDGRLHKGEQIETYKHNIPLKITFVEFTKNNNPEMFVAGAKYQAVSAGTVCIPQGCTTPFITPIAPRKYEELPKVFKIYVQKHWDELELGMDTIINVTIGLAYSPGLGLQHHALPAPLYWADGIGAISKTNHQFSGQIYIQND